MASTVVGVLFVVILITAFGKILLNHDSGFDFCQDCGEHHRDLIFSNQEPYLTVSAWLDFMIPHLLRRFPVRLYNKIFIRCENSSAEEERKPQIAVAVVLLGLLLVSSLLTSLFSLKRWHYVDSIKNEATVKSIKLKVDNTVSLSDESYHGPSKLKKTGHILEAFVKEGMKKHLPGREGEKYYSSSHDFKKRLSHRYTEMRWDRCFRQTLITYPASGSLACHYPATGSLEYHFTSKTPGQSGSTQELQKEGVRLASFRQFPPNVPVSALRLAQAGFYYVGENDQVKCFSCGETYQGWQLGDRPNIIHARISPNCPLVRGNDTTNLPLPLPLSSLLHLDGAGNMDKGQSNEPVGAPSVPGAELQPDCAPLATSDSMSVTAATGTGLSSLATSMTRVTDAALAAPIPSSLATPENSMFSGTPLSALATPMDGGAPRNQPLPAKRLDLGSAVYPLYSQMDARKRSYTGWPADRGSPSVDELITLGFFYAGYADCVRCFFCGIGLKSWEPEDIPAEVHARWRPTCQYLRLVKGDVFVDLVANGGRNVTVSPLDRFNTGSANTQQGGSANTQQGESVNTQPSGNAGQGSNSSSAPSSQPGNAPTAVQVPDLPVVQRARDAGYTDQQIAEGIEKLNIIGMEQAIDVMLVEILTNLFRDTPQRGQQRNNSSNSQGSTTAGNTNNQSGRSGETVPDDNLQQDGAGPDGGTDNGPNGRVENNANLEERHDALRQENARLRDMRTCQHCHENPVGVIFLPCGHIVSCTTCAPNIRRCIRCDTLIRATANVFFS